MPKFSNLTIVGQTQNISPINLNNHESLNKDKTKLYNKNIKIGEQRKVFKHLTILSIFYDFFLNLKVLVYIKILISLKDNLSPKMGNTLV